MGELFWQELLLLHRQGGAVFWALLVLGALIVHALVTIGLRLWSPACAPLRVRDWRRLLREERPDVLALERFRDGVRGAGLAGDGGDAQRGVEAEVLPMMAAGLFGRTRRRLHFAGVLVAAAPLVGLLGTVTGMLKTFVGIAGRDQAVSPMETITAGISEALITTQTGLVIAIPAAIVCGLLWAQLDRQVNRFARLPGLVRQLGRGELTRGGAV